MKVKCCKGEVAVFSAKHWDRRSSQALSLQPHVMKLKWWDPTGHQTHSTSVMAAKSEDYTTGPQHLKMRPLQYFGVGLIPGPHHMNIQTRGGRFD